MRLGKQQIVWGESDLFRSIDIVNPLRIDQNGFVGEAFEDFRTPIWAVKFLYDIGNVGTFASDVGWELFYTPRWRPGTNHLILEGGWDLQYRDPRLYSEPDANGNRSISLGVITKSMAVYVTPGRFSGLDRMQEPTPQIMAVTPGDALQMLLVIASALSTIFQGTASDSWDQVGKQHDRYPPHGESL